MKIFYIKLKIVVIAFLLIAILGGDIVNACSFSSTNIYSTEDMDIYYPSVKSEKLSNGEYGIVGARLGLEYLYPIYLSLSGKKIPSKDMEANQQVEDDWIKTRELFVGNNIKVDSYQSDSYGYYTNCLSDAFSVAAKTLKERAKVYNKEELKTWINGQDAVFANCSNSAQVYGDFSNNIKKFERLGVVQNFFRKIKVFFLSFSAKIKSLFSRNKGQTSVAPIAKNLSSNQLLVFDMEYQEAAALFYKGKFDEAIEEFKKISENNQQPWRGYAKLVIGRAYIRKANLLQKDDYNFRLYFSDDYKKEENKPIFDLYKNAKEQFTAIINDESLAYLHSGSRDLLNYVNFRIDPKTRMKDGENILLDANSSPEDIAKNLDDLSIISYYNLYINAYGTQWLSQKNEAVYNDYKSYIVQEGGDFLKWVLVWWSNDSDELSNLAIKKYQETNSLAWLVASLKILKPSYSMADTILAEAEKITKDSPAYLTINYYRAKYFLENNEKEKAKTIVDNLLKERDYSDMPAVENYLADIRMQSSVSLDDALPFMYRKIVAVIDDFAPISILDGKDSEMDSKAARVFNEYIPIDEWDRLFSKDSFYPQILEGLRLITFVRASILNRFDIADNMATLLAKNNKDIEKELHDYLNTQNSDDKKYLSVLFMLNHPNLDDTISYALQGVPIYSNKGNYSYHSNWWCSYLPTESDYYKEYRDKYSVEVMKYLVSEQDANKASVESAIIDSQFPSNYFSEVVINYALKNPLYPGIPEALHLAVDSAKFASCSNAESGALSKRAYDILHDNYPDNEWTKETPYWYGNEF
ncbi:MAG: hypothetical protein NTZ42_04850 [Candidatus Gribaldobacteria bacterium]|nr:hypothetical protein [Candidatus Gribaldobacteria bacterium]